MSVFNCVTFEASQRASPLKRVRATQLLDTFFQNMLNVQDFLAPICDVMEEVAFKLFGKCANLIFFLDFIVSHITDLYPIQAKHPCSLQNEKRRKKISMNHDCGTNPHLMKRALSSKRGVLSRPAFLKSQYFKFSIDFQYIGIWKREKRLTSVEPNLLELLQNEFKACPDFNLA